MTHNLHHWDGIKVVVLAGQNRPLLGPLQEDCPPSLLSVGDQPILLHNLHELQKSGLHHITVHLAKDAPNIEAAIRADKRLKSDIHVVKQGAYLGQKWTYTSTGTAQSLIKNVTPCKSAQENTLAIDATVLHKIDYTAFLQHHIMSKADITFAGQLGHDSRAIGMLALRNHALPYIGGSTQINLSAHDTARLRQAGLKIAFFDKTAPLYDLGTATGYFDAWEAFLLQNKNHQKIDKTAIIAPDCAITGPVYMEPGVVIEQGVTLRGPCILKEGAHIRAHSVLERSYVVKNAAMPAHSWASHMFIGGDWALDYRFSHELPLNTRPLQPISKGAPRSFELTYFSAKSA